MSDRRFELPRRNDGIFEMLAEGPWWMSVLVACAVFVALRFIAPVVLQRTPLSGVARLGSSLAIFAAILCLIPGGISLLRALIRGELLKSQTSISTIRNLSWRNLEELVSETYRRNGYSVTGNLGLGADGGVDVLARRGGETILVQCKQWKARKVGVNTVREMFGLLNAEGANEVHVVTSGSFTSEAKRFATGKAIRLIDGPRLLQLVRLAQSGPSKTEGGRRRRGRS
jgi:restriction system protein